MIQDSQITTYEDAEQLKESQIHYYQNAQNQRVAKEVDGVVTEKYLWLNLTTLLAIYDKDDNLIQRFNYANNRMPISMTKHNQKYYLHYDQVGTLRAVSDINHNIIKELTYDTFGNILKDTNKNFKVPFGFAGGLHDRDTNLVHFGYREYDPKTGKWTAKDPIDFSGGDSNLYGYVLGDPVGFIDPMGLFWADMSNAGDFTFPCSSCGADGGQRFPNGYFGNWSFEESCQRHDECYSFPNSKKNQCDNNFLDHMKWQCREIKDPGLKQMCLNQANAYYFAVDRFGTSAHNNAQGGVK